MTTRKPRLGCLHMHHSNIPYVDSILSPDQVEIVHFVEPGLMRRIGSEEGISSDEAQAQVRRQVSWMASCGFDAILITCTNYIATLPDEPSDLPMPVLKIDEPFFDALLEWDAPHLVLFTNPATVEGTMRRFREHAARAGRSPNIDVAVIEGTFDLVMAGKTAEYAEAVAGRLREIVASGRYGAISVGQLSMAESAQRVTAETGHPIGNPLDSLKGSLRRALAST